MGCDIDIARGEVSQERSDVYIPGLMELDFSRRYSTFSDGGPGVLGFGWRHSLDVEAESDESGIRIHEGLQEPQTFAWDSCDGVKGPHVDQTSDRLGLVFPDRSEWIFARPHPDQPRFSLTSRRDRWKNAITRRYADGRLIDVVDPEGRLLRLHYGADGFLGRITLSHDQYQREPIVLVRFHVDREGDLVAVTDQAGNRESYSYVDHLLVSYQNKNGGTVYYTYDRDRRCRQSWRDDGTMVRLMEYDARGRRTSMADSYGHRLVQLLDEGGRIVKQIDALGNTREVAYDGQGRFIAITDDLGTVGETETYNAATRELSSANGAGEQSVSEFDENGRLARRSSATWSLSYSYNDAGQIASIKNVQGYSATFEYDQRGRTKRVVGSDGYVVQLEYEHEGLRRRLIDRDGLIEEVGFDIIGNLILHRDSRGTTTEFEYDGQDIFVTETLADGRWTRYRHDGEGNTVETIDPLDYPRRIGVDRFGNVASDTDALGHAFRYEHDLECRLWAIVNKKGDRLELQYDAAGNEIARRFFEGDLQVADYDSRGRRTRITYPDGGVSLLEYDEEDRIVRRTLPDGSVQLLTYDEGGRVASLVLEQPVNGTIERSVMQLEYDANDAVTREDVESHWIEHEYDALLHPLAVRDSWGAETRYRQGSRYHIERIEEGGRAFDISWDPEGFLQQLIYPNGLRQVFDIDPFGRLRQRDVLDANGILLARRTFTYNGADRLVSATDTREGTVSYGYDAAGRLTSVSDQAGTVRESYAYDPNDNLAAAPWGAARVGAGDQVTASGAWSFEYDARGQLTRRTRAGEVWTFAWDSMEQLQRVHLNGALVASYSYDQLGRRTRKVTAEGATSFIYDEFSNLRAERRGDVTIRYVYIPNLDVPLACRVGDEWFFYSFDQLGMPTEVWSEAGRLVCRIRKGAYGTSRELVDLTGPPPPVPFMFPGQYVDTETGLCYNMFRYYNPDTASFISRDPLSIRARANHYAYPRDPVSWMDPDGLAQLTFNCKDTPKCKWDTMDCAKYVARLKLEQYRRDADRGFKRCSHCPRSGQRKYYNDKCGGNAPATHQVDHLHDLQAGGADKCCKNLVAIHKEINNCLGSVVRRMLKQVKTRCNAGTTISMIGCSGGTCKNPSKAYVRSPKQNCEDSTPKC